jgi:hypothetical protein
LVFFHLFFFGFTFNFFLQLGVLVIIFWRLLPLSSLAEAMMPLEQSPDRNRSKQKHDENTIYRPRAIRGVI